MNYNIVCIAGLPCEVRDEISKVSSKKFSGECALAPIMRPVAEPYAHNVDASYYLDSISRVLSNINYSETCHIVVLYVDYAGENTKRFIEQFFPFALVVPIEPFYPKARPKHERRKDLLAYVDKIVVLSKKALSITGLIRDRIDGKNFSPLLLPMKNFKSDVLNIQISNLFFNIATAATPSVQLDAVVSELLRTHPLHRSGADKFFTDNRGLIFKSPGRARHAFARRSAEGHQTLCFLSGRVRIGGAFDALFHYDCSVNDRELDSHYPNCHGADCPPNSPMYVNIAPNDAIR